SFEGTAKPTSSEFLVRGRREVFARRTTNKNENNRRGNSMKKLLLIGLAVSGLAFVPCQRADAQVTIGVPGVGLSFGFPGGYYAYPTRYNYYPYGYYRRPYYSIPSHIRITVATDTPRTTGVELTTAIIAIINTNTIEL